jgi:predicted ATPase/DNA-binding winged helix-turn-helix (wHTH) protein
MDGRVIAFGPFRLFAARRLLLEDDKPVRLGSRAFDILAALVERAGEVVGKEELIARAWPQTFVEDTNLRIQISALRRALGAGQAGRRYIVTVPGRGYNFVAPVSVEEPSRAPLLPTSAQLARHNLPFVVTRIIGRDEIVAALVLRLSRQRLLTIVGPGGIGKTTVAVAVADAMRGSFADGVWFVGLASLPTPDLVPSTLGGVLGIRLPSVNPVGGLTAWLRDKHALIVLDNCEHVVGAVASLAEEILKSVPRISILATSRESLGTEGEWRHRLAPLDFPLGSSEVPAIDPLQYSAVQLFNERASASADDIVIGDSELPAIVEICRRLDGVPLALELAAAHVGTLGIKSLAARLDDRFALLIQGHRTALPRHQTLRATLDWSYGLLAKTEQIVLRRLAVFQGEFTMDDASSIAADTELSADRVVSAVVNLVDKSLRAADVGGEVSYYHLLEMTRAYVLERLRQSGDRDAIVRTHAAHYRGLFAHASDTNPTLSRNEWRSGFGRQIGNLRVALGWAFSATGDMALGVPLAAAATDFWIALSLLSECCEWGLKALANLGPAEGTRDEMILQCGLGLALTYTRGMHVDARNAFTRSLALAEASADVGYQVRAMYGLWLFDLRVVAFRQSLLMCERCEQLARSTGDPEATRIADHMFGSTRYFLAEHAAAAANLERAIAAFTVERRNHEPILYGTDILSNDYCYQAATSWSLGFAEKGYRAGLDAIREARNADNPVALCIALFAHSSGWDPPAASTRV